MAVVHVNVSYRLRAWPRGMIRPGLAAGRRGRWYVRLLQVLGFCKADVRAENLMVSDGLNHIAMMLGEQDGYDTGITYQAIGSNDATPTVDDNCLNTEEARKAITSYSITGGELTCSTFFLVAECTYNIQEVGLLAGTGEGCILFNRALLSYDNSAGNYDLTFDAVVTFV